MCVSAVCQISGRASGALAVSSFLSELFLCDYVAKECMRTIVQHSSSFHWM